ncbi:MAG: accessory Sec system protein Asp1 [Cellulomonadaceae bacterium]|jgi:accessory secretory protein Asp1|nr:accessory Sec system protein Asp1 [Cellulomonadaceae bacterium]
MIRFVPAWYHPQRPWYSPDGTDIGQETGVALNDTVTQVRIFAQGTEPAGLVVLNYVPNLRRFLHRHGIADVTYWSFFDEVQGLSDDATQPINFLAMDWPENAGFFYNPFAVTVMDGAELHARIFMAPDGTLESIRFYGNGMPSLERIYDDRGFLSSVLMHDSDGKPQTQYYYNASGDVVVSEDVNSGHIDVVDFMSDKFDSFSYDSWGDLIEELMGKHLALPKNAEDTIVVALADQHNDLIQRTLANQTLVLARSASRESTASDDLINRALACFSDEDMSAVTSPEEQMRWMMLPELSMRPLDRRSTFGASANESTVTVGLFADNIGIEQLDAAVANMAMQMVEDDRTRVALITFKTHDVEHLQQVRAVMDGYQGLDLAGLFDEETAELAADMGLAQDVENKISLVTIDREADLMRTLAKTRLLVDLGEHVNQRLVTEAVCAGVPQVNLHAQDLATDKLNGYVISDESQIPQAVDYFLDGLEHWNQSLVQCNVLIDVFSPEEILNRWELVKEAMSLVGTANG